jgi:hypothetical protein
MGTAAIWKRIAVDVYGDFSQRTGFIFIVRGNCASHLAPSPLFGVWGVFCLAHKFVVIGPAFPTAPGVKTDESQDVGFPKTSACQPRQRLTTSPAEHISILDSVRFRSHEPRIDSLSGSYWTMIFDKVFALAVRFKPKRAAVHLAPLLRLRTANRATMI